MKRVTAVVTLATALVALGARDSLASPIVLSAAGSDAAAIQATVDAYRLALGTQNANVAGSFASGRREINWDGVPDAQASPNSFAANFFNATSPRGVVFSTPGTGFQVSANASVGNVEFNNVDPTYSSQFRTFSAQRLFTAIGSTITDVNFFVPGSTTPAYTTAFGAVFTDVDVADTTSLEFFDLLGISLGTFFVPSAAGNETLSFLGVRFTTEQIGRVRITSGNAALGTAGDNVVMDDFIYAEPQSTVPEPATGVLMAIGFVLFARRLRKKSAH
jgi:hypothetical protein